MAARPSASSKRHDGGPGQRGGRNAATPAPPPRRLPPRAATPARSGHRGHASAVWPRGCQPQADRRRPRAGGVAEPPGCRPAAARTAARLPARTCVLMYQVFPLPSYMCSNCIYGSGQLYDRGTTKGSASRSRAASGGAVSRCARPPAAVARPAQRPGHSGRRVPVTSQAEKFHGLRRPSGRRP
jgi:hypothetical protein